ncbi:MAG TPA: response regulator transcription factor [Spirochaetota bacterium]|nr:response regulator transcription factor [Spirochaetota bacterium]
MAESTKKNRDKKIQIIIIDDHPIVRHGIAQLINMQQDLVVCGEAKDSTEGWDAIKEKDPDLVIVDLSLENASGLDLIKALSARRPDLALLVLSMHDENLYAERAIRSGAMGYVMKQEATETLINAIYQVLKGEIFVSEKIKTRLLQRLLRGEPGTSQDEEYSIVVDLTDRELEVFQLIGKGLSTRKIASKLNLSIKTIETHRQNIKQKLNLNDSTELVQQAVQWVQSMDMK